MNLHEKTPEAQKLHAETEHRGFDDRIVRYEIIHKIDDKDYQQLVSAVDAKPNDKILDGCCGYGEVSKRIINQSGQHGFRPEIFLLDESPVQLNRAVENLPGLDAGHIKSADIRNTGFSSGFFNKVVIKMGIHELPQAGQQRALQEIFRILQPGGKFVTWDLALDDENQIIFQDIIRKKDELAGFDQLVRNRYFARLDEMHDLFRQAGFEGIEDYHTIWYRPSTLVRKEELISKERKHLMEQKGVLTAEDEAMLEGLGLERAEKLTEYARQRMPDAMKEKMKFKDLGNDIQFEVRKMVIRGKKPSA